MAFRGDDFIGKSDNGKRSIVYETHDDFDPTEWADARTAAATSLTALDTWMSANGRGTWWSSRPSGWREGMRAALLDLAP